MSSPGRQVGNRRLPPLPPNKKPPSMSPRGAPGKFPVTHMLPNSVPARVESSVARHHVSFSSDRLRPSGSDMMVTGNTNVFFFYCYQLIIWVYTAYICMHILLQGLQLLKHHTTYLYFEITLGQTFLYHWGNLCEKKFLLVHPTLHTIFAFPL